MLVLPGLMFVLAVSVLVLAILVLDNARSSLNVGSNAYVSSSCVLMTMLVLD